MFIIGPLLIKRINLLLLIKTFLMLLLRILLGLISLHQSTIQSTTVITDKLNILFSHTLLVGQHLLYQLTLIHQLQRDHILLCELSIRFYQMIKHLRYLLGHKRNGPFKNIHKVRKHIGVLILQKLLNIQRIVLNNPSFTLNFITAPLLL